jgi:toxin ParE1/3/4
MARVIWSRAALAKLDVISLYIAEFNPDAAIRTAMRLLDAGNSLATFPRRGRAVGENLRELSTVRPYIIRYLIAEGDITILRIRHAAQLSDDPDQS